MTYLPKNEDYQKRCELLKFKRKRLPIRPLPVRASKDQANDKCSCIHYVLYIMTSLPIDGPMWEQLSRKNHTYIN